MKANADYYRAREKPQQGRAGLPFIGEVEGTGLYLGPSI